MPTPAARLWHIIRDYDHEALEFILGLLKTLIGAVYLMPWSSFDSSNSRFFTDVMPEWVWGLIFFTLGVGQLYGLSQGQLYNLRAWISMIGLIMWTLFTVLVLLANPTGAGWTITFVLVVANISIYFKLRNIHEYVADRSGTRRFK
jgi:hypothetical protein